MEYDLKIYKGKELINNLRITELDLLKQYFNIKESGAHCAKIKELDFFADGTINRMKAHFIICLSNNEKVKYIYDYEIIKPKGKKETKNA